MEHLLQLFFASFVSSTSSTFQSLFLWNIYFNFSLLLLFLLLHLRFNPYFYGTSTSTLIMPQCFIFQHPVSILIFMEHLLQRDANDIEMMDEVSFNPYFYGTSTSTKLPKIYIHQVLEFQSLFLWNIYFNYNDRFYSC